MICISHDNAITIKNMLALAVADCPDGLHEDFQAAREEFLKALAEAEEKE